MSVSSGNRAMEVATAVLEAMPKDLKTYVADGRLTPSAAHRIARRRALDAALWSLAHQAGIAGQLEALLA